MKLLLTNDDGIDAPGLAVLEQAVSGLGRVTVVAPHRAVSGCSHQVTTNRPLQVTEVAAGRYALDGTPADCTRLGLLHLAPDADWVMAGINDGANLGVDVYISGTAAAVREAALSGKPGIAFSQYRRTTGPFDWSAAALMVGRVIEEIRSRALRPGAFWNVNLPDLDGGDQTPQIVFCRLEACHLPLSYEFRDGQYHYHGIYHQRARTQGSDVDVCFSGRIAVSQVLPSGSA